MIIECLLGGILFQQLTGLKIIYRKPNIGKTTLNERVKLDSILKGSNLGGSLFTYIPSNNQALLNRGK